MTELRTIETLSTEEFEDIVDQFIERASIWTDELPTKVFFAFWTELAEDIPLYTACNVQDVEKSVAAEILR
ncbi:MAG TPA: hypothetical protein PKZ84_07570 [Anaerolineae bacterium]|nr:hypothetical protein [Anaerolineae bacterium]HQI84139.1 hypothetical protein [Anaerolineae bacterium]